MRASPYVVVLAAVVLVVAAVAQMGVVSLLGNALPGQGSDAPETALHDSVGNATTVQNVTGTETYRTVVVFRNDDLEPGHRDDLRRTVDRIFLEAGVPLTHSVIPTNDGESIAENEQFCRDLRHNRREHPVIFEYALHGYLHEENGKPGMNGYAGEASEFRGLPYDEQRSRISKGAAILEECIGERPETFVPPFGTYDNETIRALAAENVTTISGGAWFTESLYNRTGPFETDGVLHVPRHEGFVRNWDSMAFYDQDHLRRHFDHAHDHGHLFVQNIHYWTFDSEDKRQKLRSFVRYVKSHDGVLFMTVGQFAEAYRDGRLAQTENGWRYTPAENSSTA